MNIESGKLESTTIGKSSFINMGNVLESDYSTTSDVEEESAIKTTKDEVRSQGDGRESDSNDMEVSNLQKDMSMLKIKQVASPMSPQTFNFLVKNGYQDSSALKRLESPKQLPPKGALIPLKPVRLREINSQAQTDNPSPIHKQRDPRFVPYEPYPGAVKSMTTDDSYLRHSRKPSNSSSVSGSSAGVSQGATTSVQSPTTENDITLLNHINHYKNQTHSLTLMKERLKIAEKDIIDLQGENARLKKLMVDSMTGALSLDSTMNNSGEAGGVQGLTDNLSDEIEVWRSKFLSSCILVDQLTKENRDMKVQISSAAHLFREIKNTAGLTPGLYDQINYWLNRNALGINSLDYNYNNNTSSDNHDDEYNYNLTPHHSSHS